MFGLGLQEIVVLAVVALLLFGPRFFARKVTRVVDGFKGAHENFQNSKNEEPGAVKILARQAGGPTA